MDEATEAGLDPGVLQHRAEPLDLRGPGLDDLRAVADHVPGRLDVRRRDEAAAQQPALQQVRQPLGVGHIGLAARHVLDMGGVAYQHLLELPVLEQGVVHRHAVDPGGLHRNMSNAQRGQPPGRLPQHPVERLERPLYRLPVTRSVTGQPDRNRDHVLAHVNCRAPFVQDLHARLPGSSPAATCTRPAEPLKETKILIHAFSTQPGDARR